MFVGRRLGVIHVDECRENVNFIRRGSNYCKRLDRRDIRFYENRAIANKVVKQDSWWSLKVLALCRLFRNDRVVFGNVTVLVR